MTYKEALVESLKQLGGHAKLKDIYNKFREVYTKELPQHWEAGIIGNLEFYSSDSRNFQHREDLFYSVEGIGKGHWGLRENIVSI